jgi:hypothetical protein
VEALVDLLFQELIAARQAEHVEAVEGGDGGDAEARRDEHHVLERRLAVDHGPHAVGRGEQLGGEGVCLDLARVGRLASEGLERVHRDPQVVRATDVAQLVRQREPLPHGRLGTVDPENRALTLPPAAAGDPVGQRGDHYGKSKVALNRRQDAPERPARFDAEFAPGLARPLGAEFVSLPAIGRR